MVAFSHERMLCCLPVFGLLFVTGFSSAEEKPSATPAKQTRTPESNSASGREIFLREWIPNDPRSHGGDGLGPVFNESSCVSCHNQGGPGGGGSEAKNVTVISAVRVPVPVVPQAAFAPQAPGPRAANPVPQPKPELSPEDQARKQLLNDLRKLHPGLVTARSVVLHNSGTDPKYTAWRDRILGVDVEKMGPQLNRMQPQVAVPPVPEGLGFFAGLIAESEREELLDKLPPMALQATKIRGLLGSVTLMTLLARNQAPLNSANLSVAALPTQRNSTALFGSGLIDSIPDTVIESAAARTIADFPEITGRVARLKDGRIGRFGWKAQKASLYDFTMTACAVELGLHVPDHHQAGAPLKPQYVPTGFDLNRQECQDLVQFLKELPAPTQHVEESAVIVSERKKGQHVFAKIGCAACHTENLGEVTGIFSDLLLHDMGRETGDSGSYGVFQPQSSGDDGDDPLAGLLEEPQFGEGRFVAEREAALQSLDVEERLPEKMVGAGRQEWRTPPLWGVRDSAPYLHDGRAQTIEQAIAAHGGEGQLTANRYFRLPPKEQASLLMFLRSLVAPDTATVSK